MQKIILLFLFLVSNLAYSQVKYPAHEHYAHLNHVCTLPNKADLVAWFENEKQYLVTTTTTDSTNPTIWLVDVTGKKTPYPTIDISPNQLLSIVQLVTLDQGRIFLRGEIASTKKPTKKKCNWFAICDNKGNIIQQKTSQYYPYQSADQWTDNQIGLLRNSTQKTSFGNKAVVDLLDLSNLAIKGKRVFEFNQKTVFVNNFKANRLKQSVLFIGLNTPNKTALDTSTYLTGVFTTFAFDGTLLFDYTDDDIERPLKYQVSTTPIPIVRGNHTQTDVFYWEALGRVLQERIILRHQISDGVNELLTEVDSYPHVNPHLKIIGQTEQYLFSSYQSTEGFENTPLLILSSAKRAPPHPYSRSITYTCLWCPISSIVEQTEGIDQKEYEFDRMVLARRQPYDEIKTHPREYPPQKSTLFPDWYFIDVVMVYRAKNGTSSDKLVSLVFVYTHPENTSY